MDGLSSNHKVYEALKGGLFFGPIQNPLAFVDPRAARVAIEVSEEKFEPMLAYEWVTFQVKENIPGAGLRQLRESKP
jgi:hypothetical protein